RSGNGAVCADALSSVRARIVRPPVSNAALVALAAVVVMVFVYYARFSGSLQWGLGLAFLGLLAILVWRQVFRGTSEPAPLVLPASPEAYEPGELDTVAASVRRAARGLRYSQVLVTSRARAAFLEHARLSFGLTPAGMYAVQQEPEALPRTGALGDPRRWTSPDRGRARPREDADREVLRRGPRPLLPEDPVHPGPPAGGHHGHLRVRPQDERLRPPPRSDLHTAAPG